MGKAVRKKEDERKNRISMSCWLVGVLKKSSDIHSGFCASSHTCTCMCGWCLTATLCCHRIREKRSCSHEFAGEVHIQCETVHVCV